MRFVALVLCSLARMFPAAALKLAEKLPALARLLVVGAVGAGGYAAYDCYGVIEEQVRAGVTTAENWTAETGDKLGAWGERRIEWAQAHPETAALWGATLLGMGALYRAHRRAGRSRAEAATQAVARMPVQEPRPMTVEERALQRAAATQLIEDQTAADTRLKQLAALITAAKSHHKNAETEATRARALAEAKAKTRDDAAADLARLQAEHARLTREREEIEAAFARLETRI